VTKYKWGDKIKEDEMGGACGSSGQHRMHTRASEACEVNRPLVKPRYREKDDIKLHHKEVGWDDVDWIVLAQDGDKRRTFVITVMNLMVS